MIKRRQFIAGLSAMAAWPVAAQAQQPKIPVIGYLNSTTGTDQHFTAAFRQGLSELGYVEGQNVSIEYHWMGGQYDRLAPAAADLVRRQVAVIVATGGTATARAAKSATATIPIVFVAGGDPVEVGLVASLNRPGGNATGAAILTTALTAKRLELLHELVPAATSIGFLVNPTNPTVFKAEMMEAETAARALGVRLVTLNASTLREIEAAFEIVVAQRIGALLTSGDPLWTVQRAQLAVLTARHAVPAIYAAREIVDAGGLISYGASISAAYRLVGTYTGRILKGEKPTDLPVQQSTKVEFVLNLSTAKALGLTIPETLLATADEVIQ
jgi:putative tryptophan/tyrosine transport system substrate-binding protein